MPYVFTALTLVFAAIYAFTRSSATLSGRLFYKTAASVMFVLVAVSMRTGADEPYYTLIVLGLCFALAGDVILIFTDRKQGFLAGGMVCFLLTHLLYIIAFCTKTAPSLYDGAFFALLLISAILILRKRRLPKGNLKTAAFIYAVVLCAMTARALSMPFSPAVKFTYALFAALGGVLFAVSDMLLAFKSFGGVHKKAVGVMSTLTYYTGQILIALSVLI